MKIKIWALIPFKKCYKFKEWKTCLPMLLIYYALERESKDQSVEHSFKSKV